MSTTPVQKRKVVIDTDCGVDDAVAISMALKHPSIDVIAITCVAGNTSLPGTFVPALRNGVLWVWSSFFFCARLTPGPI